MVFLRHIHCRPYFKSSYLLTTNEKKDMAVDDWKGESRKADISA